MELEDQVVSLELARMLKELGVKQESYFYWCSCHDCIFTEEGMCEHLGKLLFNDKLSAFTVAEILELLPKDHSISISQWMDDGAYGRYEKPVFIGWIVGYCKNPKTKQVVYHSGRDNSLADAAAKLLITLIEKGIVKP